MRTYLKSLVFFVALFFVVCCMPAQAANDSRMIKVGLYYGSTAMSTANLENSAGSGYRFGYHDGSGNFVQLGSAETTQISMLKTQNIYLLGDLYYDSNPGSGSVIGCYHLQLSGSYDSFQAAQAAAGQYQDGFPAWISGTYYARVGAYASREAAVSAQSSLGLSSATVVGTGSYGISITKTKTSNILFQFDNTGDKYLVVRPGLNDSTQNLTWFKGYKYYGDFCYERIGGGNLTVSNYVDMDSYAKGVVPYEMSASWPTEALKAQAVAAKSYALATSKSKHKSHNFDLCNTTCCQVYRGANNASDNSDAAVNAVSGVYAWHNGSFAQTFYYSSNGGASEDVQNVWTATLPYLTGVVDTYEETVAGSTSNYRWTITYTGAQLASRLQQRGHACGSSIVELKITEFTRMGNVYSISMKDNNGKTFSFSKESVRSILGTNSFRFQLEGAGGSGSHYVDGSDATINNFDGVWAIGDGGSAAQMSGSPYAITSSGTERLATGGASSTAGTFVLTGAGNGHNVGMSQYGANAMAKQGFTYDQILKFYYTGIDIH